MPKTISATQMQNRFGALTNQVISTNEAIIVASRGVPKVVLISFSEYQKLSQWREQARREKILQKIRGLRAKVRSKNPDLTEKSAQALASEISSKTINSMIDQGKIKLEDR
jgi:prevent-host-death family protein